MPRSNIYFDSQDYDLLRLVNHVYQDTGPGHENIFLDERLHPHGIIELSISPAMRIAHSVITLLRSLTAGESAERLQALRRLRDEVLHSAHSTLRYNTGRVLIQLMKEMVRSQNDMDRQLALAHDFRRVVSGAPRMVRAMLRRYHLLEMPEEWNQHAFDHHVHDASTKGRKTPTHLIMDAWIKGLRYLTVIYDNYIDEESAGELLAAAKMMDITVRVGLEVNTVFRGNFVRLIWSPVGCNSPKHIKALMANPLMARLQENGRTTASWMRDHILKLLESWNKRHAPLISREFNLSSTPLADPSLFLEFVGRGQASIPHLAEYLHKMMLPLLEERYLALQAELADESEPDRRSHLEAEISSLEMLVPDIIADRWLLPPSNPGITFPDKPHPEMPESMRVDLARKIDRLHHLPQGQIVLSLADLTPQDALEILWLGKGRITHIELFNVREWQSGHRLHTGRINELQCAINEGSAPRLKQVIRRIIDEYDTQSESDGNEDRKKIFNEIISNIPTLQDYYAISPIYSRIGTDSTSRSHYTPGMGLVFQETLTPAARSRIASDRQNSHLHLPVTTDIYRQEHYHEDPHPRLGRHLTNAIRKLPGCGKFGCRVAKGWGLEKSTTRMEKNGNLITLGGINADGLQNHFARATVAGTATLKPGLSYVNTNIMNAIKIIAGFIPAQWSFMHNDANWWVLAWFGALIWFFITGFRNIIQAVVSGGGFGGSLMLRWNDYVSWSRLADSLLYTGISVPLLEVVVRQWLLQDLMGFTVMDNALLVYTIIAMVNSVYISGHNIYRGFPKEAIIGNLFRSALAIPLSIVYGKVLYSIFLFTGLAEPMILMQNCAAIVSKCASDTIAAIIEAFADRNLYLRLRSWDYATKFDQLFRNYARQELLYPHLNMEDLYDKPKNLLKLLAAENPRAARGAVANMLDMMYFWYYQPRARQIFISKFRAMSEVERKVALKMQNILTLEREISHMLLDGLIGPHFPKALAFYLNYHSSYLKDLHKKTRRFMPAPTTATQPASPDTEPSQS